MPNHPQAKSPEYQFNNGKLYVMTRNSLVTYDGRSATISDAFSPKTLLILGVVIGYIPLFVCLNIAASIIESRGGMFDLIFLGFMTLLFAGGAARFARTGRQVLRTVSSADLPSADLNDPAYKAHLHLHAIYQRESRKSANLPVGLSWIRKLVGWLVLLAFGGMALVEAQVALGPKTNLTPLEKQLLDSVSGGSHRAQQCLGGRTPSGTGKPAARTVPDNRPVK